MSHKETLSDQRKRAEVLHCEQCAHMVYTTLPWLDIHVANAQLA